MPDIFSVSPPAWLTDLTRPSHPGMAGQIIGELVGGMAVAAQQAKGDMEKAQANGEDATWLGSWLKAVPRGIQENRLNVADPMWRLKAQQAELGMAHTALGLQETQLQIDTAKQELRNEAQDQQAIPAWLQSHQTPDARSAAFDRPVPRSKKWQGYMHQIDANDVAIDRANTQSVLEKATFNGLKELSNAVDEISKYDGVAGGALSAKIAPFAAKGQMPPPAVLQEVATAREAAQTKKFERDKEMFGIKGVGQPAAQKYLRLADEEAALAEDARVKGDVSGYQEHNSRANDYRALAAPKTTEITTSPTGETTVTMGKPAGSKTTTATATRLQETNVKYENALSLINQLQKNLTPADVGPAGVLGEMVLDVALPAFGVNQFFSGARVSNRTSLATLRESLLRQISDDPRFSNVDRAEVSKGLPKDGIYESYPDAMQRMATVRAIITDRLQRSSATIGAPAPAATQSRDDILKQYETTRQQLIDAVRSNRMTPQQAIDQDQKLRQGMQNALEQFH